MPLPRTQEGLNALLNINSKGEYMADTIEIAGSIGQFPVKFLVDMTDKWSDENFVPGLFLQLGEMGVTPPVRASSAAPAGASQAQNASANRNSGGGCPVHGTANQKQGFRGNGFECGASSTQPTEWTKDAPFNGRNGPVYYCKSKWG